MGSIYHNIMTRQPHKPQRQMIGITISHQKACVASVFVGNEEEGSIGMSDGYKNRRPPKQTTGIHWETLPAHLKTATETGRGFVQSSSSWM